MLKKFFERFKVFSRDEQIVFALLALLWFGVSFVISNYVARDHPGYGVVCTGVTTFFGIIFLMLIYRERLRGGSKSAAILELLLIAFSLGTSLGWICQTHGLGYTILEGVGIVVLVELLVWGVLSLARLTEKSKKVLALCAGFAGFFAGLCGLWCSNDWKLFMFVNTTIVFLTRLFFYSFRRNEGFPTIFGATLFGFDTIWMGQWCQSFFWTALTALAVLSFVRTAVWVMMGDRSSSAQPGHYDLGVKFAAWVALVCGPATMFAKLIEFVRKSVSGLGKKKS